MIYPSHLGSVLRKVPVTSQIPRATTTPILIQTNTSTTITTTMKIIGNLEVGEVLCIALDLLLITHLGQVMIGKMGNLDEAKENRHYG